VNHPLFTLPDEEFEEALARANADLSVSGRLRACRDTFFAHQNGYWETGVSTAQQQEALALWHSLVPTEGFRWPWPTLDRQVGLLPVGDLAVVLAQTGSGKTTFTASLLNLIPKTKALVFATEIPAERYMAALASRRAGLNPDKVELGMWESAGWRMTPDEAKGKHQQAVQELRSQPLTVAPYPRLKTSQLRETLLKAAETSEPEVVVVDHFQAIRHDLYEGVGAVQATIEVLLDFAQSTRTTVIVTNQVHVRGQGGLPPKATDCIHLSGVFGGQALGQAASQILGVHRCYADFHGSIPITPAFLTEWHKSKGKDRDLWDRTKVAIDFPKIRYDAHGNVGTEVRLDYKDGRYCEPEEG